MAPDDADTQDGMALDAQELAGLYEAKARAELARADAAAPLKGFVAWSGEPIADIALVKGVPGEADIAAGRALAGADGEAAGKALGALGFDVSVAGIFATCSRSAHAAPNGGSSASSGARTSGEATKGELARLELQLEAVDPRIIVALDAAAARDVTAAFEAPELAFGKLARVRGRIVLAVDGLEASLLEPKRKARVWRQFKALTPLVRS